MVAKIKFEPLEELSAGSSFAQAAHVLDIAAQMAVKKEDIESLINIGAVFSEMGSRIAGITAEGDEEEEDDEGWGPLGFFPPDKPIIIPVEEVLDERTEGSEPEDA